MGHPPLLAYMAVGMGEPRERVRAMCIEVSFGGGVSVSGIFLGMVEGGSRHEVEGPGKLEG